MLVKPDVRVGAEGGQFPRAPAKVEGTWAAQAMKFLRCIRGYQAHHVTRAIHQHVGVMQPVKDGRGYFLVEDHQGLTALLLKEGRQVLPGEAACLRAVGEAGQRHCLRAVGLQRVPDVAAWREPHQRGAAGAAWCNQRGSSHLHECTQRQHVHIAAKVKGVGVCLFHAQERHVHLGVRCLCQVTDCACLGRGRVIGKPQGYGAAVGSFATHAQHLKVLQALRCAGKFHVAAFGRGEPLGSLFCQVQQLVERHGFHELAVSSEVDRIKPAAKGLFPRNGSIATRLQPLGCLRHHGSREALTWGQCGTGQSEKHGFTPERS